MLSIQLTSTDVDASSGRSRVGVPRPESWHRTCRTDARTGGGLLLRKGHLVHLHRQRDRGVVAEQDEHFRDALAAERLLDPGEFGVRQFRTTHQRGGKPMDGAFMCVGEFRILAGEDRVDGLLRQAGGLALADMRLPDVVALPVLRDHQNADFHLALRQRRELVEEGPDPLHAAGDGRTVDPDLVRPEDAPAPGGELIEDLALLGRKLFRRNLEDAVHDAARSLGSWGDGEGPQSVSRHGTGWNAGGGTLSRRLPTGSAGGFN